jgi:multiple sugar transport system ATP-binding protein
LDAITRDVHNAAQTLGIEDLLARKPRQLSGGQRQRVAVGRALVREPQAFLLDEPLSNLDAKLRVHMRTEISELHRRLGATFIYVTHDQAEAMTMSNRIAVMMDGELLQVATPEEIYGRPANLRVAEFIGSPKINVLPVAGGSDGRLHYTGCALPFRTGNQAVTRLGVRPEAFSIVKSNGQVSGRVVHRENFGSEACYHVQPDGAKERVVVRTEPALLQQIDLNDPVALSIDGAQVLAFDAAGDRVDFHCDRLANREVA